MYLGTSYFLRSSTDQATPPCSINSEPRTSNYYCTYLELDLDLDPRTEGKAIKGQDTALSYKAGSPAQSRLHQSSSEACEILDHT